MKRTVIFLLIGAFLSVQLQAGPADKMYRDVPPDHWAYEAIRELTEKGILEGYIDKASHSYKGEQSLTRYEFALALAKAMVNIEEDILARNKPVDIESYLSEMDVSTEDIELLTMLIQEFKKELNELNMRVTKLERETKKASSSGLPLYLGIGSALLSLVALTISLQK